MPVVVFAILASLALVPSAQGASMPLLTRFCEKGILSGECTREIGSMATDPVSGNLYVVDGGRDGGRVQVFTPWGEFVRAWGGGVLSGGATGTGTLEQGSAKVTSITTTEKRFEVGMALEGTGVAPDTRIASVGVDGSLTLTKPATAAATGATTAISSPEAAGNVPVNEVQRVHLEGVVGGAFQLRFRATGPSVTEDTTDLPFNASAAEVQAALEALDNIGADNVSVSGAAGGPYRVEFIGRYADTDVLTLQVLSGTPPLSDGTADVQELTQGAGAAEICTSSECRPGIVGRGPGQIASAKGLTVDSNGDVYVYESSPSYSFADFCAVGKNCNQVFEGNNRVQKFDSEGNFLLAFGRGVNEGGGSPASPGDLCTAEHVANGDLCGGGERGSGDG
ncbi:MAG TPA: hypothetical protein VFY48_10735, partial [Solirubrobacterales bacterium]|nr:hypothetical protein [Solirubrobacterales bacterium]